MTKLNELSPREGSTKGRMRVGRGGGSGKGKTAGRGAKGQKARTGNMNFAGFEGGQMPLQRRIPKRGFTNYFRVEYALVNVGDLEALAPALLKGAVGPEELYGAGLFKVHKDGLKILGDGEITKAVTVRAHKFSGSAREKIEKAGGQCEVIEVKAKITPQERKKSERAAAKAARA